MPYGPSLASCCCCCCGPASVNRFGRSVLQSEPHRFHRWLSAEAADDADGDLAESEARRLLSGDFLAVQLQPSRVELRRMQSYSRWKVSMQLNGLLNWFQPSPDSKRIVAVRPLETLPPRFNAALCDAMPYLRAYYPCLEMQLLPDCQFLASRPDVVRREVKGSIRLEAGSVLRSLISPAAPGNCAVADLQVGVCHTDLYPGPDMLGSGQTGAFILGQSSAQHKAAVVCFGRGSSAPVGDQSTDTADAGDPLLNVDWRVRKVLSHELGHMLGLDHCCVFACNMNSSESMAEALGQPLQLCPLCLAKLCRLFRGCLTPASWAESVLSGLCPELYPAGSRLRQAVSDSVSRLNRYSELDSLV